MMQGLSTDSLVRVLEQEAVSFGVSPAIARAILLSENSFFKDGKLQVNPQVSTTTTSPAGAVGIMQVMPATYQGLVKKGLLAPTNDPTTWQGQIRAGLAAIKERMNAGISDPVELAISYNGSPAVLEQYRRTGQLPGETQEYVRKFSAHLGQPGAPMDKSNSGSSSSRTSGSTSFRNIPEDLKTGITTGMDKLSSFVTTATGELRNLSDQILGTTKKQQTAEEEAGRAKAEVVKTGGELESSAIANRLGILDAFGINLQSTDNRVQQEMQKVAALKEGRSQLQAQISALRPSLVEDPLGAIVGMFQASPLIQKHNQMEREELNAMKNIQDLQALAANQVALQPANIASAIQRKALAEAKVHEAEAAARVAGLETTAKMHVARNMLEIFQMQGTELNQRLSIARVLTERDTLNWSQEEREKVKQEEIDKLAPINLLMDSIGQPNFTPNTFRAIPKDMQERLGQAAHFGRWGRTPGEAVSTIYEIIGSGGVAKLAAQDPIRGNYLRMVVEEGHKTLTRMQQTAATNPMSPEATALKSAKTEADKLQIGVDTWYQAEVEKLKKNKQGLPVQNAFEYGDRSPFKFDIPMAASLEELKDNLFSKFVLDYAATGAKGSNFRMDDKLLLQHAVAQAALQPKNVAAIAQELHKFYSVGYAQQRMLRGTGALGIDVPWSYHGWAKVNTWSEQPVQMLNPQHIEQWITMQVAAGRKPTGITTPFGTPGLNPPRVN